MRGSTASHQRPVAKQPIGAPRYLPRSRRAGPESVKLCIRLLHGRPHVFEHRLAFPIKHHICSGTSKIKKLGFAYLAFPPLIAG